MCGSFCFFLPTSTCSIVGTCANPGKRSRSGAARSTCDLCHNGWIRGNEYRYSWCSRLKMVKRFFPAFFKKQKGHKAHTHTQIIRQHTPQKNRHAPTSRGCTCGGVQPQNFMGKLKNARPFFYNQEEEEEVRTEK